MKLRASAPRRWKLGGGALAVAGLMLIWGISSWIAVLAGAPAIFFPGPIEVLRTGIEMLGSSDFWRAVIASNLRVVGGFLLAVCLAVPLGVTLGAFPSLESLAAPITDFGRYLPIPALVPLSIIWAGVGDGQKVLVLAIGTFFHLLVMVTDSIRRVPQLHVESALTLGTKPRRAVSRVLIPAALPQIFDAFRVAVALTWSYLLVAELVAAEVGLGAVIIRGQRFLQTDRIFFTIFVLGLLGLAYDRFFTTLRPRLFPWSQEGS